MILFGPFYVQTQHYYGSLRIVSLQLKFKKKKKIESLEIGVAKSDMTREPEMTNPFINRSWVEAKRV